MKAPPLLVSFSSVEDYLSALAPHIREEYQGEIKSLVAQKLPPVVSSRALSCLFGLSTKFINALRYRSHKYYRQFSIRKGKKVRKIKAPRVALKVIQKWFGEHLSNALNFEDYVFGFVSGRSAIASAAVHSNAAWVFSVDIEDFFSTTPANLISEKLQELGYSSKACELIVPLCCYGGFLAQGAPSSPVLSNLAMRQVDQKLHNLALKYDVRYTRYADDITYSGKADYPEGLKEDVKAIFADTPWNLSQQKEFFAQKPQRRKVHGLLVHGDKPRLTKGYRNKIRAFEHMLNSEKVHEQDIQRIKGHINYAKSVEQFEQG